MSRTHPERIATLEAQHAELIRLLTETNSEIKAMKADIFTSAEDKPEQIAKMQKLFEEALEEMKIRI